MSYPYGPEPYPTWEQVEHCHTEAEAAFWSQKERLDMLAGRAERKPMLATDEMKAAYAMSDCERAGLAFGHALDTAGIDEPERFMRDLFNLMEDGLVARENRNARNRED